jgi:hypothetical protein
LDVVVCLNERQAEKDAADRNAIIESLKEKLKAEPKSLVGNKGFRKCLSIDRRAVSLNEAKVKEEAGFDGKWVLRTNMDFPAEQVALEYKELAGIYKENWKKHLEHSERYEGRY